MKTLSHLLILILTISCTLACSNTADAKDSTVLKRIKGKVCKMYPTSKDWSSKTGCMKVLGDVGVDYLGSRDGSDNACLKKATSCYPEPKRAFDACRTKVLRSFDWDAFKACNSNPTATPSLCYRSNLWDVRSCARKSVKDTRAQVTIASCIRTPESAPKFCPASAATASRAVPKKRRPGQKCAADKIEKMLVGKGYFSTRNFDASARGKLNENCGRRCDRNYVSLTANGRAGLEWHQTYCIGCPMRNVGGILMGGQQSASGCATGSWVNTCDAIEVRACPRGAKACRKLTLRLTLEKGEVAARQSSSKNAGGILVPSSKSKEVCSMHDTYCGYR